MKKYSFILYILFCCFNKMLLAQCNFTLSGKVIDHHDRKPLEFAELFIKELKIGALTDSTGNYKITGLCNGTYTILCKHLGCDDIITSIIINENTIQHFYPEHHLHELGLVTILTEKAKEKSPTLMYEMKGKELDQKRGMSLGEALKSVTGVNVIQTGANISKPVIHGLHSNRILILNNGIRQEGQQWGSEHAPEIDPFIANQLTIIKGASAVRYGSDAIAGVLLVQPNKLRDSAGIGAELNIVGATNGRGGAISAIVEQNFKKITAFSWRLQGTLKKSGNVSTPNYYLNNTGVEEYNFSVAAGWKKINYGAEIFYSQFNTSLGIYSGAHIGNITDLMAAINRPAPIGKDSFAFSINRPYQHVAHELFKASSYILTGNSGKLNFIYARQYNLRNEFDKHKPKNDSLAALNKPELQFEITSHTMDVFWEHNSIKKMTGTIGISAMQQSNTYEGRYFIPNFRNYTGGLYWIERFTKNKLVVELGVRYDYRFLEVFKYENNILISPIYKYDNTTFSIGGIYKLNKSVNTTINLGTAWRAPSINELYTNGVHHGAATYEIGNKNLTPEKITNLIVGINYDTKRKWKGEVDIYYNYIHNYIYLQPKLPATVTISGAFPTFVYTQTKASFTGIDAQLSYLIFSQLMASGKISLLWAQDKTTNDYLIQMPADRCSAEISYYLKNKKILKDSYISMSGMFENKQWRVSSNSDYLVPPKAYFLLNAELVTTVQLKKQQVVIGIGTTNLLNTSYRNYMNRFRYYADEMGRNISLRLKFPLNYSPKNN